MIKLLKKLMKWYFEKSAETYAWTPSGMIPYMGFKIERKKMA